MAGNTIIISDGADEVQIQRILSAAIDGDTIIFPEHQTISISSGLSIHTRGKSLTLDLNGSTLQQAGDATVLTVNGYHNAGDVAKLGETNDGQVTVTYQNAAAVEIGSYVKIYSDDVLPNDQGASTRMGQAMKVVAVNSNVLTLGRVIA